LKDQKYEAEKNEQKSANSTIGTKVIEKKLLEAQGN